MPNDEDEDDVAIDDASDDTESDSTDGGDADEPRVAAGGPVTQTIAPRRGTRPISAKVREVFAKSMAKMKPAAGEDDSLEPMEHEDLPQEKAPVLKPAGDDGVALEAPAEAPPSAPAAAAQPAIPAAPQAPVLTPPPAPTLDPEVMRLRTDLEQQRKAFDEEKSKFFADQREHDVAKLRDVYYEKGAPAVVEVLKKWTGENLEGDALKREIGDLITELAHNYLDAPLEESVRDRITNKRTRDGLKIWKAEQERAEQERLSQLKASQEHENRLRVKGILQQEVTKPDHAKLYPFLTAEDNPGEIVYAVLEERLKKTGEQLKWQDAAKEAEDWLAKQSRAFYDKRSHLLSPTPPAPQAAPADKQRAQGDNQVSRSHAPPKKPTPPPAQPERPVKWTPEMHRANTMKKFRGTIQALTGDEE